LAVAILSACLPREAAAEVLGDLEEVYCARVRLEGRRRAGVWYWSQVIRFVGRLAAKRATAVGHGRVNVRSPRQRASSMSTVVQDIRYAIRTLLREPGFTAVAILILAVGIGANVAMFSVTEAALFRTLPFPEADRLVMGRTTWSGRLARNVSSPDYYDYRDQSQNLQSLAAITTGPWSITVTGGEEPERLSGVLASVDLFPTLRQRKRSCQHRWS
jgi:hypothetical protein